MSTSNTAIANMENQEYQMKIAITRSLLHNQVNKLTNINIFMIQYQRIHGTTTECSNILGQMGVLPPKERTCTPKQRHTCQHSEAT